MQDNNININHFIFKKHLKFKNGLDNEKNGTVIELSVVQIRQIFIVSASYFQLT